MAGGLDFGEQGVHASNGLFRARHQPGGFENVALPLGCLRRKQNAAHGGAIGGQARTRHQRNRHHPLLRGTGHINDFGLVQNGDGSALADLFRQSVEQRLHDARQRHGGKTAGAEPQHLRRHGKELAVVSRITEFRKREQATPRRGAVQSGNLGGIGNRQARPLGAEGLDNPQSLGETAHHVSFVDGHVAAPFVRYTNKNHITHKILAVEVVSDLPHGQAALRVPSVRLDGGFNGQDNHER